MISGECRQCDASARSGEKVNAWSVNTWWMFAVCSVGLQSYMDSEIRAIMAQYMPLDSQNEPLNREGLSKPSEGP